MYAGHVEAYICESVGMLGAMCLPVLAAPPQSVIVTSPLYMYITCTLYIPHPMASLRLSSLPLPLYLFPLSLFLPLPRPHPSVWLQR